MLSVEESLEGIPRGILRNFSVIYPEGVFFGIIVRNSSRNLSKEFLGESLERIP